MSLGVRNILERTHFLSKRITVLLKTGLSSSVSASYHIVIMINPPVGPGGVCRLLTCLLHKLESNMDTSEDSTFLQDMLMGNTLHLLIKVYDRLQKYRDQQPTPLLESTEGLLQDLAEDLRGEVASRETSELLDLLSRPHVQGLLSVHDTVAQKDYDPQLPPLPTLHDNKPDEEDSFRIITMIKNQEPLGATVKRDVSTGAMVVARIMRGGAADLSGLIHEGDKLEEVNGVPMEDRSPEEIIPILAQSEGTVTFKVIPGTKEELATKNTKIFMRALFDYDPKADPAITCKDVGLEFRRGDVLQIVSQEDDTWWQAKHQGEANLRAGLIPSRQLQERRMALQRPEALFKLPSVSETFTEDVDYRAISGIQIAGLRRSFRLSRKDSRSQQVRQKMVEGHGNIPELIYQEVSPYHRKPEDQYRLVLLTGPSGVGVTELKRKLLLSDPEHFSVTVPYTTREQKRQEKDGVDYHFISKHTFEKDILNHKFLEYGEHSGNYYGLNIDSVRRVLEERKVCLLDVEPHVIEALNTSEFKPYVVFVKPPSIERLKLSRRKAKVLSSPNEKKSTKTFTENDFEDMITSAQAIESKYCHLFDKVTINDDLAVAFTELRDQLRKIETESHWIPHSWADVLESNSC
ncbi:MAGUK p55 subfamily member 7 isoform X2 [Triplophysa dalaica]|uniref:MAGUK p55 subfamily member 7 isoform X2 n=1 Tax=Triplophysa dalaica TaxID=1582913 RepID=UPI0024DFBA16|nr:MAGUK p55 subfamily member 7 isoform X2 [Triplophysa dalaica]